MDTSAMVGLMELTFFCNECVEVLYKFKCGKVTSDSEELKQTCERAITAFKSLKWPIEPGMPSVAERAIFNTDTLIQDLQYVIQGSSLEERKQKAEKLQRFFDTLGDYSFYAIRDSFLKLEKRLWQRKRELNVQTAE